MKDERYKQIMNDLGMPNSRTLLLALQQVAMESALYERERRKSVKKTEEQSEVGVDVIVLSPCPFCGGKA